MLELLKSLYRNFGYHKTFSGSQLTEVFSKELPHASKVDKSNWSHRLRKKGIISVVGVTGYNNEYVMRLNEKKAKDLLRSYDNTQQKSEITNVGEVGYFVGDTRFNSMDEAVEYCKKFIIQTKRKRVVWEEI